MEIYEYTTLFIDVHYSTMHTQKSLISECSTMVFKEETRMGSTSWKARARIVNQAWLKNDTVYIAQNQGQKWIRNPGPE